MYRFPKVLTRIKVFKRGLGVRVENNHPLLNDEDDLYTNAIKIWWNENSKQIVELVKR